MFSCVGTEGCIGFLLRNGWYQCFPVLELNVLMVPDLEMGGSNVFMLRNKRFQRFPIWNGWFQYFHVKEWKVPIVPVFLVFLFRN